MLMTLFDAAGACIGTADLAGTHWTMGEDGFANAEMITAHFMADGEPVAFAIVDAAGRVRSRGTIRCIAGLYGRPDQFQPGDLVLTLEGPPPAGKRGRKRNTEEEGQRHAAS